MARRDALCIHKNVMICKDCVYEALDGVTRSIDVLGYRITCFGSGLVTNRVSPPDLDKYLFSNGPTTGFIFCAYSSVYGSSLDAAALCRLHFIFDQEVPALSIVPI